MTGMFLGSHKLLSLLALALGVSVTASRAIAAEVPNLTEILSKKNRKLQPPPRTIKSDRFDPNERFVVALERSETAVSISDTAKEDDTPSRSHYEVMLGTNRKIRDKVVSLGVMSGGTSGLVGGRVDFALDPVWLGAQIGSGVDYMTWGLGLRKYLFPNLAFIPFVDFRYTEWLLKSARDSNADYPFPQYATRNFFKNSYEKQTAHLLSPGLGMAYVGREGFGLEVGAQYMWSLDQEQGAVLGSLGLVRYF